MAKNFIRIKQGREWVEAYPPDGYEFGPWKFNAADLTLRHQEYPSWAVYLERCGSSEALSDWIFQAARKWWVEFKDIGYLIQALHLLLAPQANLCSGGMSGAYGKTLDAAEHIRSHLQSGRLSPINPQPTVEQKTDSEQESRSETTFHQEGG